MAKTFILHDESLNTFGFWIKTSGLVLDQFVKNPTMYFMHIRPGEYGNQGREMLLPIGTWTNIRVEGTQLLADPEFDMDDDFAKRIAGKVEKGIIRMASAGINPVTWSDDRKLLKPGQTRPTLLKGTVVEASIVDRGSNENAFRLYDANMQLITLSQDPLKCEVPLINNTENEMKTVFGLLKLADTANEAEAYQAIVKLNEKLTALEADKLKLEGEKTKLEGDILKLKQGDETAQKEKINTLVDEAVKARKILAANKADYVALAEKDFDNTKKILDGMAPISKLIDSGTGDVTLAEKYKGKTWKELDKVEGALAEIKLKDPNHFKELFKVEFGTEPTM